MCARFANLLSARDFTGKGLAELALLAGLDDVGG
jgi:hypothetical protein